MDAEIGANKKKSHNFQDEWAVPIGIAHFLKQTEIQIGIDRAEREGCLLPERQEDGSRRKQKIIFYMKGWLQNVKTKYL